MHGTFTEFSLLLLICALAGAVFLRPRQPVLIAYIVVGIAVVGHGLLALDEHIGLNPGDIEVQAYTSHRLLQSSS